MRYREYSLIEFDDKYKSKMITAKEYAKKVLKLFKGDVRVEYKPQEGFLIYLDNRDNPIYNSHFTINQFLSDNDFEKFSAVIFNGAKNKKKVNINGRKGYSTKDYSKNIREEVSVNYNIDKAYVISFDQNHIGGFYKLVGERKLKILGINENGTSALVVGEVPKNLEWLIVEGETEFI